MEDDIEDLADEDKITGYVHSIDSFTAVDGAGIRCIFFLQSCHKRCVFCCNVDSTDAALARANASTPTPLGRRMRVRECVDIVRRNLDYYSASGGGVTLSGGECLLQPEFARAVCRGVRALGVGASIDTAGAGTDKEWNRVLPHVDCVLLCLKSAFVDRYVAITGTSVEEFDGCARCERKSTLHKEKAAIIFWWHMTSTQIHIRSISVRQWGVLYSLSSYPSKNKKVSTR